MGNVFQIVKSKKTLVVLLVPALVACAVLGYLVSSKQKELASNAKLTTTLMEQLSTLEKTTVPADDYNNLVRQIQSLKIAVGTLSITSSNQPMDKPEQICYAVKQILAKQQQLLNSAASAVAAANASAAAATSPTEEVDFLVGLVAKEIAQVSVVDTQLAEKNAVVLYHMQKVLDALGYKLNDTIKTTNQAVIKYQTDNQLKPDGKIGPKTWVKIRDAWNAKRPGGPMPSATPPAAPAKPQTQSTTTAKPLTTSRPSASPRPSLSSVTTRSSVRP